MVTYTPQAVVSRHVFNSDSVVLIVDDSEVDRYTYRRYLESSSTLNCSILESESAEDTLQICLESSPDVILLDYSLPDGDGLQLLVDLAAKLDRLPTVIMLTGQGSEAIAVKAMKHGARDYLVKGQLSPEKLTTSVANALTEQHLKAEINGQHRQRELLTNIALKISHSINLPHILQSAVEGTRELLDCDRALIYRFNPDMSGTIVTEVVLPGWTSALDQDFEDNCFQDEQSGQIDKYLKGHKMVVSDIESAPLTPCHLQLLKQFQVRGILVIPILFRNISPSLHPTVWGLLIAHHCQKTHVWKTDELALMDELSTQVAIAIQQAELVSDLRTTLNKQQEAEHRLRDRVVEIEHTNTLLSQATHLLEKRNLELDEFTHIVSHDLRSPLRNIQNLVEWLTQDLENLLPSENKHQFKLIQSRINQMNELIDGLLQYARIGRDRIDFTKVDISQLLKEVVDILMPPTGFQIRFAAHLPTLQTQPVLLRQVFVNLIGNAIKYHDKPQGNIEVLVEDKDPFLQFTVVDDGPGIALEHHKSIFNIFQTVNGREPAKGTGIGLAIVKKIVDGGGGSVWVESEEGKGSAFHFTWLKTP